MPNVYMYILKADPKELYAFTTLKEFSKRFENERNMDLFIRKKKFLDDVEIMPFQYQEQSKMLQKDVLFDGEDDFDILLTSYESATLDECCTYIHSIMDMISTRSHHYPLKSKYLKIIDEITSKITMSQDSSKPTLPVLNINTFKLFYYLFSKTLHEPEEIETF